MGGDGSTLDFYTFEYHTVSIHQHFSNVHYQHLSKEHMLCKKKNQKESDLCEFSFSPSTLSCFFCKSDGISCFNLPVNLISLPPLDQHSSSCHGRCVNIEHLAAFLK